MARSTLQLPLLAPLLAAGVATVAGCSSGTPDVRVRDAEARLSPSLVGVCAIFLTLENAGDGDDALVGASLDLPGAIVQLHAVEGGRMVERRRLVVPSRGALALRPGGPHVMVFNLPGDAAPGDVLTLRLRLERSGERVTSVRIGGERSGREADQGAVSRRTGSST